jgi:hypothetical protein
MAKKKKIPDKLKIWVDARKRFHLSHEQIQMARELGMNPKKFGNLPAPHLESLFYAIKDGDPDKLDSFLDWERVSLRPTPLSQGEELLEELHGQMQEHNLM